MIIWQEHDASEASSVFINPSAHLDNDKACNKPENHQENRDSPCPIQPCSSTQSFCISRLSTESSGNDCHNSEISPITGGERSSSMKAKGGGTKIGSIPGCKYKDSLFF